MSSRFDDKRIWLYRFQIQTEVWRFTQADRNITAGGFTWYAAKGIGRDGIRRNDERAQRDLKIKLPYIRDPFAPVDQLPITQDIGDLFHPYAPSSPIIVSCFSLDALGATPRYEWSGQAAQPRFKATELELTCALTNARALMRGQGLRWQRNCPKVPYSTGIRGCNLDPADFLIAATLTAVDGLVLTSPAFATAPLSLLQGWFHWTRTNGRIERRPIFSHSGDTIRLLYGGYDLDVGLEATALPNCEGNWDACSARRPDPQLHYGGAIYEPVKNPVKGVSMSWGG